VDNSCIHKPARSSQVNGLYGCYLLSSGLYRRLRNSTGSCQLNGSWALPPVGNKRLTRFHPAPKVIQLFIWIITRLSEKVNGLAC
jgi:hypothetical protein